MTEELFCQQYDKYKNTVYSVIFDYVQNTEDTADLLHPGDTAKVYYYESEDKCGFINEQYQVDYDGNYHFQLDFYDPDDLNTGYIFTMTVHDKKTGYAIINSLTFDK